MSNIFLFLSGNTTRVIRLLVTQRIGALLISIGITFMLNTAALAEFKQVKTHCLAPRSTAPGAWSASINAI
jgi:hypothetical protein